MTNELTEITGIIISYRPSDWEDYSARVNEQILIMSAVVVVVDVVVFAVAVAASDVVAVLARNVLLSY